MKWLMYSNYFPISLHSRRNAFTRAWLRPCPIGSAGVDGECHPCDFPLMQDVMFNGHHMTPPKTHGLLPSLHFTMIFVQNVCSPHPLGPNFDPSLVLIVVCWCFMPGWEQNQLHWTIDIATLPLCSFELYRSFVQAQSQICCLGLHFRLPHENLFKQCKVLHQLVR